MKSQSTNIWKLIFDSIDPVKQEKRKIKEEKRKQKWIKKKDKLLAAFEKFLSGNLKRWSLTHKGWKLSIEPVIDEVKNDDKMQGLQILETLST